MATARSAESNRVMRSPSSSLYFSVKSAFASSYIHERLFCVKFLVSFKFVWSHCFDYEDALTRKKNLKEYHTIFEEFNYRLLGQNGIWMIYMALSFIYHMYLYHPDFFLQIFQCTKKVICVTKFVIFWKKKPFLSCKSDFTKKAFHMEEFQICQNP